MSIIQATFLFLRAFIFGRAADRQGADGQIIDPARGLQRGDSQIDQAQQNWIPPLASVTTLHPPERLASFELAIQQVGDRVAALVDCLDAAEHDVLGPPGVFNAGLFASLPSLTAPSDAPGRP